MLMIPATAPIIMYDQFELVWIIDHPHETAISAVVITASPEFLRIIQKTQNKWIPIPSELQRIRWISLQRQAAPRSTKPPKIAILSVYELFKVNRVPMGTANLITKIIHTTIEAIYAYRICQLTPKWLPLLKADSTISIFQVEWASSSTCQQQEYRQKYHCDFSLRSNILACLMPCFSCLKLNFQRLKMYLDFYEHVIAAENKGNDVWLTIPIEISLQNPYEMISSPLLCYAGNTCI